MNYYFIKSVNDGTRIRVMPLPNQYLETGDAINADAFVTCSKSIRDAYPVGTVFAVNKLDPTGASYSVIGDMVPVTESPVGDSKSPSREILSAWKDYQQSNADVSSAGSSSGSGGFAPGSLFDKADGKREGKAAGTAARGGSILSEIRLKYPCPSLAESGYHIDSGRWNILVRNILRCENTMLVGPMGTGKTEIVLLLGRILGIPVHVYDMGSMHDPMSQMLGTHRLVKDPVTGATVSGFDYAQFTRDIQEEGIVLLDELSRAPLTTLNILFPCLDSRRMLPVEMAGGEGLRNIPIHPKCHFVATANLGVEYTGTNAVDKALMSRFFPVELDYLDEGAEMALLLQRTGCAREDAANIVKIARRIRDGHRRGDYSTDVSTRETLRAASLAADGWPLTNTLKAVFLPLFEPEERETISRIFISM